ncbi:MAG: hypothetical protein WC414_02305 [Patescibacteria group bacterium]
MKKTLAEIENWATKLTATQIDQLPEEEIIEYIMERPGHPGQYGFMLGPESFKSIEEFSTIFSALMNRLNKIENLENKMTSNKEKTEINLVSLQNYLQGRKWEELTKEEQLNISGEILKMIFPNLPKK